MVTFGKWHGVPQRRPYPGDVEMGSEIFRLGQKNEGEEVITKPVPGSIDRVAFTTFSDAPRDPGVENVATWQDLSLGLGLPEHVDGPTKDRRYYYTGDSSTDGLGGNFDATSGEWMPGPSITTFTPVAGRFDATYGWTHYVEWLGVLYVFGGSFMASWNGSALTVIADFHGGGAAQATASTKYLVSTVDGSGVPTAYVTFTGRGRLRKNDGTTADTATVYAGAAPVITDVMVGNVYNYATYLFIGFGSDTTNSPNWIRWDFTATTGVAVTDEPHWDADPICATGSIVDMRQADNFAVIGGFMWIATKAMIYYVSGANPRYGFDPYSSTGWGLYAVGDGTGSIKNILESNGTPYIFKADGVFTINSDNEVDQLFPALTQSPNSNNGRLVGAYEDDIYVTYNNSFYRISPDDSIESVGLDQNTKDLVTQGSITAFAPQGTMRAYAILYTYQAATPKSYLMQWGAWTPNQEFKEGQLKPSSHVDAWHGPLSAALTGKCQAMFTSTIGASADRPRMYILSDGTTGLGCIRYFTPPQTANPSADPNYTFNSANATVFLPRFYGIFRSEPKLFQSLTLFGRCVSGTAGNVTVYYRVAPGAWSSAGTAALTDGTSVSLPFNSYQGTVGNWVEFKIVLTTTAGSVPILTSMALAYSHQVSQRNTYEMYVLVADNLLWRNGVAVRQDANTILNKLRTIIDQTGTFTIRFWGGAAHLVEGASDASGTPVRLVTWGVTEAMDDLTGAPSGSVYMKVVEVT